MWLYISRSTLQHEDKITTFIRNYKINSESKTKEKRAKPNQNTQKRRNFWHDQKGQKGLLHLPPYGRASYNCSLHIIVTAIFSICYFTLSEQSFTVTLLAAASLLPVTKYQYIASHKIETPAPPCELLWTTSFSIYLITPPAIVLVLYTGSFLNAP